ncbi:MarR family transcriptional regulator [Hahella sp. CCB-MM4]|uniref:transcriptional regulator SlyA n=1 Tax=Hahella sp. (strain CCB-MM4) TaxID=1926491 RepID=UPI000B9AF21D|nr:transcriptional regulator SlyA [Hahella sp. CCB-MM4]OZG72382.1 MarR family transcriptional regulator [Hahella sp. CCB-MM4]
MSKPREEFGFQLSRLSRLWRRLLDDQLSDLGLTQSRWVALMYIQRLGGGLTQKELASALAIESPTLVRFLEGLEKDRLITRSPCARDGRAKRINLTEEGESFLVSLNQRASGLRQQMMNGISDEEIQTCMRVFQQIRSNASALDSKFDNEACADSDGENQ